MTEVIPVTVGTAKCNLCPDDETRFTTPWDEKGPARMDAHLAEVHNEVLDEEIQDIGVGQVEK